MNGACHAPISWETAAYRQTRAGPRENYHDVSAGRKCLRLYLTIVIALALAVATLVPTVPSALADSGCPIGKSDHQLTRDQAGRCVIDNTPPTAAEQEISAAKEAFAHTYAAYRDGSASRASYYAALTRVEIATGVLLPDTLLPGASRNEMKPPTSMALAAPTEQNWRHYQLQEQLNIWVAIQASTSIFD